MDLLANDWPSSTAALLPAKPTNSHSTEACAARITRSYAMGKTAANDAGRRMYRGDYLSARRPRLLLQLFHFKQGGCLDGAAFNQNAIAGIGMALVGQEEAWVHVAFELVICFAALHHFNSDEF